MRWLAKSTVIESSPVVSITNSKYSRFAVLSVAPVAMLSEPQEPPASLFSVLIEGLRPVPADADAVTRLLETAGARALLSIGNCHSAKVAFSSHTRTGGGVALTTRVAVALLPVSVSPMKRFSEALSYMPASAAVTSTSTVQLPLAAMVPPASAISSVAGTAVTVPPQVEVAFAGEATSTPAGSSSKKLYPAMAIGLGLVIVNRRREVPPSPIVSGTKRLENPESVGSNVTRSPGDLLKSVL